MTYKTSRNKVNINIQKTKSEYFVNKIRDCSNTKDPKKSWSLVNSLLGKNFKSTYINELKIYDNIITDSTLIAESFNNYFINIGALLVNDTLLTKSLLMSLMIKMSRVKIVCLKIRVFIFSQLKFIRFTRP